MLALLNSFVIDKEGKDKQQHFDYFIPSTKKLFSFKLESGGEKIPVDMIGDKKPTKISMNYDFDFTKIEELITEKMVKEKVKGKLQKMLFSLQKVDGKDLIGGTIFLSMMGLLQVQIDISKMEIICFEKKSFFDIVKVGRNKKD